MPSKNNKIHFIGPFMERYEEHIRIMVQHGRPLLFIGESGTGKRQAALIVNDILKKKGLANVNCPGKTHELIMSELFGYAKGAFTGAHKDHIGQAEKASKNDQVLYLDEIGEMDHAARAVFLNALQEMWASPVGADRTFPITCPIVATMADENKSGMSEALLARFRKIYLPPLRLRYDYDGKNYAIDILHLVRAIIRNEIEGLNIKLVLDVTYVDRELLEDTCRLDWPGNIRDLSNFIIDDAVNAKNGKACRYLWRFQNDLQKGENPENNQRLIPIEEIASYTPSALKVVQPSLSFTQNIQIGKQEIATKSCNSFILREMHDKRDNRMREIILKRKGIIPWGQDDWLLLSPNFTVVLEPIYEWLQEYKRRLCWGFSLPDILDVCELIIKYEKLYKEAKQFEESEFRILEAVEPGAYSRFKASIGSKVYHQIKTILIEETLKGGDDFERRASHSIKLVFEKQGMLLAGLKERQHADNKLSIEDKDNESEVKKQHTLKILREERAKQEKGYKPRAAKRLGISLTTLYNRIDEYELTDFKKLHGKKGAKRKI